MKSHNAQFIESVQVYMRRLLTFLFIKNKIKSTFLETLIEHTNIYITSVGVVTWFLHLKNFSGELNAYRSCGWCSSRCVPEKLKHRRSLHCIILHWWNQKIQEEITSVY